MKLELLSKTEQVRRAIPAEILSGRLRPGERLLEARLAKELGLSQANRATNVSRYTLPDIERLFAVRVLLEPAAASAVGLEWSKQTEGRLTAQVDAMWRAARSDDLEAFCLADYEFHQEIYRLSGNRFLAQAGDAIANGAEAAVRETRGRIEKWLDHSRRALAEAEVGLAVEHA